MRNLPLLMTALMATLFLTSCVKDQCTRHNMTYTKYEPIYTTYEDIRQPIAMESPRALQNPGKIYMYNNYIYINEIREGVHVIDNNNPSNPQKIGFIPIPGNMDIAIKNDVMYADNYTDLITLDVSNEGSVELLRRIEDAYPIAEMDAENGMLVGYHVSEVTEDVPCDQVREVEQRPWQLQNSNILATETDVANTAAAAGGGTSASRISGSSGTGGSMARFTIYRDHLYVIDNTQMSVYDINMASNPLLINVIQMGWGIETIMPYEDKLFIGTNSGVLIYDNINPASPTFLAQFNHATSCDPVYVDNDFAYVTLRSGTACDGFNNQLDILDVSNISNPSLVRTYPMNNPHGLSVDNNTLYLCDGDAGLKVYDVTNKLNVDQNMLAHITSLSTYDVIASPSRDLLMVVGSDGFYQYDRSNPNALNLLSNIPVE